MILFLVPACGTRNFLNENDKLRAKVMELETRVKELTARAESAERRLEIEKQQTTAQGSPLPEGVVRPAVSRIEITAPSRGQDTDNDGKDDAVRIRLATYDHRGRFVLALAAAHVTVAAVPAGRDAVTLATREFDAKAFDAAYRSGFGGTHYTLTVPLARPVPDGVDKLTVTVKITDLLTGATHEAEKIVSFGGKEAETKPDEEKG